MSERQVAYILDPRFPGGTSAAVAQELRAISQITRPKIYAISSRMFKGKMIAPALKSAFDDLDLTPIWDPSVISADIVILHNPSFLKFQTTRSLLFADWCLWQTAVGAIILHRPQIPGR